MTCMMQLGRKQYMRFCDVDNIGGGGRAEKSDE